jgi:hypothetical protein
MSFVHEVTLCLASTFSEKRPHRSIVTADLQLLHKCHNCQAHFGRRVAPVGV